MLGNKYGTKPRVSIFFVVVVFKNHKSNYEDIGQAFKMCMMNGRKSENGRGHLYILHNHLIMM